MTEQKVALISGANRGIGLECARQLAGLGHIAVIGARDDAKGRAACDALAADGLKVDCVQLDVTDQSSARAAVEAVVGRHGRLDILINNAGILSEKWRGGTGVLQLETEVLHTHLETNLIGPLRLAQLAIPHMQKTGYGRIVNVSSQIAQLASMSDGHPAYRISKAALNVLTGLLSSNVSGTNIKVNSASPGWVRTDMGGASAPRSVEQGADTIVWLATLPDDGPSGKFFADRKEIAW
jgi:NAD(P)-dependent dehydrogenase (short-subunit alcohol dehydrogenase family)